MLKGLEEEVYTGTPQGDAVGLSHEIAADLQGFATEPDSRNVEYITAPYRDYRILVDRLMAKRCRLRSYLAERHGYTLIPGSTLSLEDPGEFQISNPKNPYYRHIAERYGTTVVTASTHINLGVEDPEEMIRAYRVLRAEASLYLAMTASSPFIGGKVTGAHSNRWLLFPETPRTVPFFTDHAAFRVWMAEQLRAGVMFNPRHLWLSIRPNGPDTPDQLNRLELRICDRISRPRRISAVTALYEARVWQVLRDPDLDPLAARSDEELIALARANERAAAQSSLEAEVEDWRTGRRRKAHDWISELAEDCMPVAREIGFAEHLEPIAELLEEGNLAQRWIRQVESGRTPRDVLAQAIRELTAIDREYDPDCPSPL